MKIKRADMMNLKSSSEVIIGKSFITCNIDTKRSDDYDYDFDTLTIHRIDNSGLILRGINLIGSTALRQGTHAFQHVLKLEYDPQSFEMMSKNKGILEADETYSEATPILKIEKNVALLSSKGTSLSLSDKDQNDVIISLEDTLIKVIYTDIYNIINLRDEQIKLGLTEDAFIIKVRASSKGPKKSAGKPREITPARTIGTKKEVEKPVEPVKAEVVTEPEVVEPKAVEAKTEKVEEVQSVEQPTEQPKKAVISTLAEIDKTDLEPVVFSHPDDGFERVNCHNFIVCESSKGQFEKSVNSFVERSEGFEWKGPVPNPYRNVLITPITLPSNRSFLTYLKEQKEKGVVERVMFDSGGFQVMTGSLSRKNIKNLDDLLEKDTEIYTEEDWADIYILPDHPPVGEDSFGDHEDKIVSTVDCSLSFVEGLPDKVKSKCAPVFHVKYLEQIDYFYEAYKDLIDLSQFATFSASGKTVKDKPRQLDVETLRILQGIVNKMDGASLHCLGVASPPAVFCLAYLGVRTFDSSTATKVAATGKVLFPYMTAQVCTDRGKRAGLSLTQEQLDEIKEKTNHSCPYCEDVNELKQDVFSRKMHNLIVLDELNWHYRNLDLADLANSSSFYHKRLNEVVGSNSLSLI